MTSYTITLRLVALPCRHIHIQHNTQGAVVKCSANMSLDAEIRAPVFTGDGVVTEWRPYNLASYVQHVEPRTDMGQYSAVLLDRDHAWECDDNTPASAMFFSGQSENSYVLFYIRGSMSSSP